MSSIQKLFCIIGIFLLTFSACQKKTASLVTEPLQKESQQEKAVANNHYFEIEYLGTEVLDSTSEMIQMAPMFEMMMKKEGNTKFMIKENKILEFSTDVSGALTSFSIFDTRTKMKEAYGELDMEKVYTIYDNSNPKNEVPPSEDAVTFEETDRKINGFDCKKVKVVNDKMIMEMFYTEAFPVYQGLPDGQSIEGFPLEVNLIMEGVKFISGVKKHSTTLPHPEFFNVDQSLYRKVTNEEFPKKRSMF